MKLKNNMMNRLTPPRVATKEKPEKTEEQINPPSGTKEKTRKN